MKRKIVKPSWAGMLYSSYAETLVQKLVKCKTKDEKIELIAETIADIVGEELDAKANGGCDW